MIEPGPEPTSAFAAVRAAANRLEQAGIETARLDAEVLLRHVLGIDRTAYFLRRGDPLLRWQIHTYDGLVAQRLRYESVAYIVGYREFMGRDFAVGPGVLVPRPETEILVEWALDQLSARPEGSRVLDVGTGSGAIALSLAAADPQRIGPIVASDLSITALAYASQNRASMNLESRVALVRGDLADWHSGPIDLLVANLPYLRPEQVVGKADLAAEPAGALVGGIDGLDLIARLLQDAPRLVGKTGAVGLEIDPSQADAVLEFGATCLPSLRWRVLDDLAGHARHVIGEPATEFRRRSTPT